MKRYFGDWDSYADMARGFGMEDSKSFPRAGRIIFAFYENSGYEGGAVVIYRGTDGKLYEVRSSHCSCNGLEWDAGGEVTPEALVMRPDPYWRVNENSKALEGWKSMVKRLGRKAAA